MKLYYFPIAPSPTRVRIYLGEKGIHDVEMELVSLTEGQQNPMRIEGVIPSANCQCFSSTTAASLLNPLRSSSTLKSSIPILR